MVDVEVVVDVVLAVSGVVFFQKRGKIPRCINILSLDQNACINRVQPFLVGCTQ
jgi:hypothetical protein